MAGVASTWITELKCRQSQSVKNQPHRTSETLVVRYSDAQELLRSVPATVEEKSANWKRESGHQRIGIGRLCYRS